MILEKKETAVAYRCPACGASVMSMVGIFTLTADMIRLKCPCGESEMEIVYTKDRKIRLNVPCFMCPNPHSFLISSQTFFERDLFALSCPTSGVEACFIGHPDRVTDAMKAAEKELLELLDGAELEDVSSRGQNQTEPTDPHVLDIVLYVVHELADEGNIRCGCEDGGEYDVEIHEDHLTVLCTKCGRSVDLPTSSLLAARDYLSAETLNLK